MNLFGLTEPELTRLATDGGMPQYRGHQLSEWLYKHHAGELSQMSNLPAAVREAWAAEYQIRLPEPELAGASGDGTRKYTWEAFGGDVFESALIPADDRLTLCVSSQAGCRVGCKFCLTAKKGLKQNLSSAEIVGQYRNLPERDRVTHFVYMGMGEPLDNTNEVLKSLDVLTAEWGYAFSARRITVSTVGILPDLQRLLDQTRVNVAVSLHAARREERLPLVPSENRFPIAAIVDLLRDRAAQALPPFEQQGRRRLSFEITMIRDMTDRTDQAAAVRDLIQGIPARVNLIPWNSFPGTTFQPSERGQILAYQAVLRKAGITTTIRESRGEDIGAACGLLAGRRAEG